MSPNEFAGKCWEYGNEVKLKNPRVGWRRNAMQDALWGKLDQKPEQQRISPQRCAWQGGARERCLEGQGAGGREIQCLETKREGPLPSRSPPPAHTLRVSHLTAKGPAVKTTLLARSCTTCYAHRLSLTCLFGVPKSPSCIGPFFF